MTGSGSRSCLAVRTNGAMVWDRVRALYGLKKEDYEPAEAALRETTPGTSMTFWQPNAESLPPSGSFGIIRVPSDADTGLGFRLFRGD